jgi:NADH-quinone oxidoreductase subunit J
VALLLDAFRDAFVDLGRVTPAGGSTLGAAVFRSWVLPFEVLSVLLLAALVGAIVLTRHGAEGGR